MAMAFSSLVVGTLDPANPMATYDLAECGHISASKIFGVEGCQTRNLRIVACKLDSGSNRYPIKVFDDRLTDSWQTDPKHAHASRRLNAPNCFAVMGLLTYVSGFGRTL